MGSACSQVDEPKKNAPAVANKPIAAESNNKNEEPKTIGSHTISEPTQDQPKKAVKAEKRIKGITDDDSEDCFKIIVCGSGESGKTTFLKNLKLNYLGGISEEERKGEADSIRSNIVEGMINLLSYIEDHGLTDCIPEEYEDKIDSLKEEDPFEVDFSEYADLIKDLWDIKEIKETYLKPDQIEVTSNLDFFFNKIEKISSDDYIPSDDDLLRLRKRTVGIRPMTFDLDEARFKLHDVGGQVIERKNWPKILNDAEAVIWVMSFSEFDRKMFEDSSKSRWEDAMELFDATVNGEQCINCPIFVLGNKWDLFTEKIEKTDTFQQYFQNFTGNSHSPDETSEFLINKMRERVQNISGDRTFRAFKVSAISKESVADVTEKIFGDLLRFFE